MMRISKNKYLNAALTLILLSGIAHVAVLGIIAIQAGNIHPLNFFAILQFDHFFPKLADSQTSDLVSIAVVLALYGVILAYERKDAIQRKND